MTMFSTPTENKPLLSMNQNNAKSLNMWLVANRNNQKEKVVKHKMVEKYQRLGLL